MDRGLPAASGEVAFDPKTQRFPPRAVDDEFCQDITYNYYMNPRPADGSPSLRKHFPVNGH